MRINLQCPFHEKDSAKQLGARWDGKLRVWYVENTQDLSPFARWLPDMPRNAPEPNAAATTITTAKVPAAGAAPARNNHTAVVTGSSTIPHCGCEVLPWDDCACTRRANSQAFV